MHRFRLIEQQNKQIGPQNNSSCYIKAVGYRQETATT